MAAQLKKEMSLRGDRKSESGGKKCDNEVNKLEAPGE